jgi:hypothetical protein
MARLPVKTEFEHEAALAELSCPHLGEHGCEVYSERPLICRLFGTTPSLLCPNSMRPVYMIDRRTEEENRRGDPSVPCTDEASAGLIRSRARIACHRCVRRTRNEYRDADQWRRFER